MLDLFSWAEANKVSTSPKSSAPAKKEPPTVTAVTRELQKTDDLEKSRSDKAKAKERSNEQQTIERYPEFKGLPPIPSGWIEEKFVLTHQPGTNLLPDDVKPESLARLTSEHIGPEICELEPDSQDAEYRDEISFSPLPSP